MHRLLGITLVRADKVEPLPRGGLIADDHRSPLPKPEGRRQKHRDRLITPLEGEGLAALEPGRVDLQLHGVELDLGHAGGYGGYGDRACARHALIGDVEGDLDPDVVENETFVPGIVRLVGRHGEGPAVGPVDTEKVAAVVTAPVQEAMAHGTSGSDKWRGDCSKGGGRGTGRKGPA